MINAKEEIIEHINGRDVELVRIAFGGTYRDEPQRIEGTLDNVLNSLDFNYDDGYGGQHLYGYIWYKDGTWSERGEYDGAEWWERKKKTTFERVNKRMLINDNPRYTGNLRRYSLHQSHIYWLVQDRLVFFTTK